MKYLPYILGAVAIGTVSFFVIRPFVEPRFSIKSYDAINKNGEFSFGGNVNSFGIGGGGSATARNGYVVTHGLKEGAYTFELFKDGKFIRKLKTI